MQNPNAMHSVHTPIMPPPGSTMNTASISATESCEILDLPSSRPSCSDIPSISTQFERIERIDMDNIKNCHIKLNRKITFCDACKELADAVDNIFTGTAAEDGRQKALINASARAFQVLQSRFSDPHFWEYGLNLFLSLEFQLEQLTKPPRPDSLEASEKGSSIAQPVAAASSTDSPTGYAAGRHQSLDRAHARKEFFQHSLEECRKWKAMAMEMVDEEHRAKSAAIQKQMRLMEERRQNQNRWADAAGMFSAEDLSHLLGFQVVGGEDAPRPAASRNARDELRVVTITSEHKNNTCVVCIEDIPVGQKAKIMPCGHYFHDKCLLTWLETNHVCPLCRAELPTEKTTFDLDADRVAAQGPPPGSIT